LGHFHTRSREKRRKMLRTAALASFLFAGSVAATEDAKTAGQHEHKSPAREEAKKTDAETKKSAQEEEPTPSLRGADAHLHAKKNGTWTKAPVEAQGPPWQYFKFSTLATRDQDADSVQLMEVYFYADSQKIPAVGVTATDPLGYTPSGEGADKAVDGDITTKWLDFQKQYLLISFASPISPTAWSYVTGDDSPERDPADFTMEASTDQNTWTLVTDKAGFVATMLRTTETDKFTISGSDPSGDVPSSGGGAGGSSGCGGGCAFLIIFFVGFFVYFAAGFAYNYKNKELRGVEAIPQVDFWKDLPFLVKDGVLYVKNKVTGNSGYSAV